LIVQNPAAFTQDSFQIFGDRAASLAGRRFMGRMNFSGFFFGPKRISYKYYLEPVGGKAQHARREQ
jgi:hypothetical protein